MLLLLNYVILGILYLLSIYYRRVPRLRERGGNIGQRTQIAQTIHNRRLNITAEDQLVENLNFRNHAKNTRTNENREHRNKRVRANALRH